MGSKHKKNFYFKTPLKPQATNKEITTPTQITTNKLLEPDAEPNPAPTAPEIAPSQNSFLFIIITNSPTIKTYLLKFTT